MISSKTHEIVVFYSLKDPLIIYKNLEKGREILDSLILSNSGELDSIRYIQKIGEDWRTEVNYGWLLVHGFLIFSDLVSKQALPSIVKSNCLNYMYSQDVYRCDSSPDHDVIFSRNDHAYCPKCLSEHKTDVLPRLKYLWEDFHTFYSLKDVVDKGLHGILKECHGYDYPLRRLDYNETNK